MNLSPSLATFLNEGGWDAVHWSEVGDPRAPDRLIFNWAKKNNYTVITHDLDFSAILAATKTKCPSVIQIRTQDVSIRHIKPIILTLLKRYESYIEAGALLTFNETNSRIRLLPLQ